MSFKIGTKVKLKGYFTAPVKYVGTTAVIRENYFDGSYRVATFDNKEFMWLSAAMEPIKENQKELLQNIEDLETTIAMLKLRVSSLEDQAKAWIFVWTAFCDITTPKERGEGCAVDKLINWMKKKQQKG